MSNSVLVTPAEFSTYQGGTGTYSQTAVQNAITMAETKVMHWLNTGLVPTTRTEEHPWPVDDGKIMLDKVRLSSITSVVGLHSPQCDCTWTEVTDCAFIFNAEQSIIQVIDCAGAVGRCYPCGCAHRVRVTYTYGFTAAQMLDTTSDGFAVRAAIMQIALSYLRTSIGLGAQGNFAISSWSSVGYSESRQFNERGGAEEEVDPLMQNAYEQLRYLRIKRAGLIMRRKKGAFM